MIEKKKNESDSLQLERIVWFCAHKIKWSSIHCPSILDWWDSVRTQHSLRKSSATSGQNMFDNDFDNNGRRMRLVEWIHHNFLCALLISLRSWSFHSCCVHSLSELPLQRTCIAVDHFAKRWLIGDDGVRLKPQYATKIAAARKKTELFVTAWHWLIGLTTK